MENETLRGPEFETGSSVVYGLHGRCSIESIEDRTINGAPVSFYKLRIQRQVIGKPKKDDSAIFLPVSNAAKKGLRAPADQESALAVLEAINNREYFFSLNEKWLTIYPKLEKAAIEDGVLGLAKVLSYLHVLRLRQVVSSQDVQRFYQTIQKALVRELSEALTETHAQVEQRLEKILKQKTLPDN